MTFYCHTCKGPANTRCSSRWHYLDRGRTEGVITPAREPKPKATDSRILKAIREHVRENGLISAEYLKKIEEELS